MKNVYALVCSWAFICVGSAQPVLTASNYNFIATQEVVQYAFDTTGFDPGSGGAAVSWNFTSFPASWNEGIWAFDPGDSPYASSFPTATAAVSKWSGYYEYYMSDVSGQYYLGRNGSSVIEDFSDPIKKMSYPFTYLSTYTDNFYASFTGGTYNGNTTVTGDGYGTLTIPTGIFNNVLRVKSEEKYYDASGTVFQYQLTYYDWVTPGTHFPLMTFVEYYNTVDGKHPIWGWYIDPATVTTGIEDETVDQLTQTAVFPNPTTAGKVDLLVNHPKNENIQVTVTNTAGQQLMHAQHQLTAGNNRLTLDVTGFSQGMYLVEVISSLGKSVQKLVIE